MHALGRSAIMISFYKTRNNHLHQTNCFETDCWINVVSPSAEEINLLRDEYGLEREFLNSAMDEEEASRIEHEEDQTLIIIDIPYWDNATENHIYSTFPMSIVVKQDCIITICLRDNIVVRDVASGMIKALNTKHKTQFVLFALFRMVVRYLQYLRQIDKRINRLENQLRKSMRNQELTQLIDLQKSLVYFQTSLKSNEATLEKIRRGRAVKLYEEDHDLLEDVIIESKQALEMCNIYSSILSGTMDAFSSIISNNLNMVMKQLTSITIIMAIPTMIFSFYGMNIGEFAGKLPFAGTILVPLIVAVIASLVAGIGFYKKDYF
jgi:magnesium transporter